jgi:integrase
VPVSAVEVLKEHRKTQLELHLKCGLGKPAADSFVFGDLTGAVRDPDRLSQDWKRFIAARGLPRVRLHSLRHSHASGLLAKRVDPGTVSKRLGHASVTTTMAIYAHAFDRNDEAAAEMFDALLKAAD